MPAIGSIRLLRWVDKLQLTIVPKPPQDSFDELYIAQLAILCTHMPAEDVFEAIALIAKLNRDFYYNHSGALE